MGRDWRPGELHAAVDGLFWFQVPLLLVPNWCPISARLFLEPIKHVLPINIHPVT